MLAAKKEFTQLMTVAEQHASSDETLATQVRAANQEAFAKLVERHSKRFYRITYRYLHDQSEAEDLVQSAFLKFWSNPERWDPSKKVKFTTWFYRVVVNLCLDHLKKKKPELPKSLPDISDQEDNIEVKIENLENQSFLEAEIKKLPIRQQSALNLCFFEGLSNQEAADIMGIKLKALQSLLMRAKETLKKRILPLKVNQGYRHGTG